jgi:hypothetical protein
MLPRPHHLPSPRLRQETSTGISADARQTHHVTLIPAGYGYGYQRGDLSSRLTRRGCRVLPHVTMFRFVTDSVGGVGAKRKQHPQRSCDTCKKRHVSYASTLSNATSTHKGRNGALILRRRI